MSLPGLAERARRAMRQYRRRAAQRIPARQRRALQSILGDHRPTDTSDAEADFDRLQATCEPKPAYGYDRPTMDRRGRRRAAALREHGRLHRPQDVLEIGAGDGMTAVALAEFGHRLTLNDLEDWRDERAKPLQLVTADIAALPLPDASFDFVYSFNTFEHLPDPALALQQLLRVLRPGGRLYLDFGPIYPSPWGLHASSALNMPYPQHLFSEPFWRERVRRIGIFDLNRQRQSLQPLNRWRWRQYDELFHRCGATIVNRTIKHNVEHLDIVQAYPRSFRGRQLELDDLTVQQMDVLLQKPDDGATAAPGDNHARQPEA